MLVRHCARVMGDVDAEEAAQDALLKAHRVIRDGYQVRRLAPWLRTVAHNIAITKMRAARAQPAVLELDRPNEETPDRSGEQREQLRELRDAVAGLPTRQREAIVMREFEGRSYEQISVRLGTSEGAVRQLLNRARQELRSKLAAINVLNPIIRWMDSCRAGRAVAASGGCAATIKLCAAAVLPALPGAVLATASKPPSRHRYSHVATMRAGHDQAHPVRATTAVLPSASTGRVPALAPESVHPHARSLARLAQSTQTTGRAVLEHRAGNFTAVSHPQSARSGYQSPQRGAPMMMTMAPRRANYLAPPDPSQHPVSAMASGPYTAGLTPTQPAPAAQ
jgi:RNA polymerase sigma factor (sigma-70 family)